MPLLALWLAASLLPAPAAAASRSLPPIPALPGSVLPAAAPLEGLARSGYAIVPAASFMDAGTRQRLLAVASARDRSLDHWTVRPEHDFMPAHHGSTWNADPGRAPDGSGGLRAAVERLGAGLRQALPGERFELSSVELRAGYSGRLRAGIHYDGTYLTVTYALRGAQTPLFVVEDGKVRLVAAGPDEVAVVTGQMRALETGGVPILHNDPEGVDPDRVLLIVRYMDVRDPGSRESMRNRLGERLEEYERVWKRRILDELVADRAPAVVK